MKQAEQKASDDAVQFVLAGCMVEVCLAMAAKDNQRAARIIDKAIQVLNKDHSFIKRFNKLQTEVMAEFDKLGKATQHAEKDGK